MPRSIELFAGGGGMALGMLAAGFEHDQLVELYRPACEILRINAERQPSLWKRENVREMDVRDWLRTPEIKDVIGIDLVAGGPPCQPFSIGGARAGHADGRNMFPAALEVVRKIQPRVFVFENVPGLLRESFLPYYDYITDWLRRPSVTPKDDEDWFGHWGRIKRARRSVEYHVDRQVIDAADLGVEQTRKRVFVVGIRSDLASESWWKGIPATHSRSALLYSQSISGEYWMEHDLAPPPIPLRYIPQVRELKRSGVIPPEHRWRTTRDAICGLPEPVVGEDAEGILNHCGIPGARTYRGHTGGWIDWPAKTLKAGVHGVCGGEGMVRFSDGTVRYLTVREAARIQTFPDDYELAHLRTVSMRVLGNAVAVDVATAVGRALVTAARLKSSTR